MHGVEYWIVAHVYNDLWTASYFPILLIDQLELPSVSSAPGLAFY